MLSLLALGLALVGPVPTAIERSVRERLGEVRVSIVEMTASIARCEGARARECEGAESELVAVPEPGARIGRPMRFVLVSGGARVGSVVASLEVTGRAVRARRTLSRDERVDADAVDVVDVEFKDLLLRRLPALEDVVGTEVRRNIMAGEVLTDAVVVVPPTVRSGDEVRVSITAGPVAVTGVGRASGSGRVGDVIRVLTPSSRRPLKARITGPGSVEIVR